MKLGLMPKDILVLAKNNEEIGMKRDAIIELENYIFTIVGREARAASVMSGIVGVLCGVKPTTVGDFAGEELKNFDPGNFIELLDKLGLKVLVYDRFCCLRDEPGLIRDFYISKDVRMAKKIHKAFQELWLSIDDAGQTVEPKKWERATWKIGKLLGYPKTAIRSFVNNRDLEDERRVKLMKRNRYYTHSVEHEEEEYAQYDRVVNAAIDKYAPKTARYLSSDGEKRWL